MESYFSLRGASESHRWEVGSSAACSYSELKRLLQKIKCFSTEPVRPPALSLRPVQVCSRHVDPC